MAIDFYKLGRQSGAKTPKGQQSGFQSLVSSATKPIEDMLKASQEKTAALTADMPQGIPIDKVPEELRVKATEFLSTNKKAYTDATKVIASGINAQSEQYKKAVETINSVNTRFENLSTSLEAVALKRQASLDDPMGYSPGTGEEDRLTWSNLGNGDLYDGMTFNEDGTVNYTDSKGESKSFADFNVSPQSFEGQNIFLGLNDKFTKQKYSGQTKDWSVHANEAESTINQLFQKLKPAGQKDMMMADVPYLEKITGFEAGTNEYTAEYSKLLENPNEAIASYKSHILETLKNNYNAQNPKKQVNNDDIIDGIKLFKSDQTFSGGVTGGRLNAIIKNLDSGTLNMNGMTYNKNPQNNSWTPEGVGETISGNKMLKLNYEQILDEQNADSAYPFYNDERFVRFKGTEVVSNEKIVTEDDKEAYTATIQNYFTEELSMFDKQGNYIQSKGGLGDNRFSLKGKSGGNTGRKNFANIINKILKDKNIDKKATTSAFNQDGITLNGKDYSFADGNFDYYTFMEDLNKIIMGDGSTEFNPPQKSKD